MKTLPVLSLPFETPHYQDNLEVFFTQFHQQHPVFCNTDNTIYIATYKDCYELLTNHQFIRRPPRSHSTFSLNTHTNPTPMESMIDHWMVFQDPPYHTHLRNAFGSIFSPNNIMPLEKTFSQISHKLFEKIPRNQPFDFVEHFAYPFPILVIASFFNIDDIDLPYFKSCSYALSQALNTGDNSLFPAATDAVQGLRDYFLHLYEQRKHQCGNDLFSLMIAQHHAGKLSLDEIIDTSIFFIWAGHETTKLLLSNTLLLLLKNPDQLQYYYDHPHSTQALIEESLRIESPIQKISRWTSVDTHSFQHEIPANTLITALLGAANRDTSIFNKPEQFIINRTSNKHIAFGKGIHHCLGTVLARMEGKIVFDYLRPHIHDITLVDYQWRPTSAFRCLEHLTLSIKSPS